MHEYFYIRDIILSIYIKKGFIANLRLCQVCKNLSRITNTSKIHIISWLHAHTQKESHKKLKNCTLNFL